MMALITNYVATSGTQDRDRMDLVHRESEDGERAESWVIEIKGDVQKTFLRRPGKVTGLWRSDAGRGFAVADKIIYAFRFGTYGWASYDVEWTPVGVYGLDDRNVWVWGREYGAGVLHRWNGGKFSGNWDEVACPGEIRAMHGTSLDNLFAVGDGFIARWDGETWKLEGAPGVGRLCSVFTLEDQTAFACGEDGQLWKRTDGVWTQIFDHHTSLACVAFWKGTLWVGEQGELGLSQFDGETLVSKKPNLPAVSLDVRDQLLFACGEIAGHTKDGESYRGRNRAKQNFLLEAGDEITTEISG